MSIKSELFVEELVAYPDREKIKRLRKIINRMDKIKSHKLKYKPSMVKYQCR